MLENLSEQTQLILIVVLLAILFFAVLKNNKRNKEKRYDRKSRNFRENIYKKKKERDKEEQS
ncbi:hypothetical protein [Mesonia oceanica]|uniref:Uncharacterized protein n=1 Tax=Mesonia oceanica TaxID=2687242 RepID=A0AC61YA77_9FLAO|nr:hypothetical protein [Mesonia oceanica]MAQ40103.1 hypothetical protein [Mesonia sp.]MBJ96600.1 hypothetical protein [Flavobacteriaceae bacterium]VVV01293.1 hypothetical protein FVB9532_02583 [Mesonia oceanica]|tara:strand:+ start:146 stop:331 length:186 start_codon:yes stop_codon:yes gene_type:complete